MGPSTKQIGDAGVDGKMAETCQANRGRKLDIHLKSKWFLPVIKKLSSKGQIVLPAEYRKSLGLKSGHSIEVSRDGDRLILRPVREGEVRFVRSSGYPRPLLSIGKQRVVRDRDIVDLFDDEGGV